MSNAEELGLHHLQALGPYEQVLRRESPEWLKMSRRERLDEILDRVEAAAKSRFAQDPQVRAKWIAEKFLTDSMSQWPYWEHLAQERSQRGVDAWHVMQTIARSRQENLDKEAMSRLFPWMLRHPGPPSRRDGRPPGGRDLVHVAAIRGVYALRDAGLCDLTGKKKGGGSSCCDLVARRLDVDPHTVYNVWWRDHRKQLAQSVDRFIAMDIHNAIAEAAAEESTEVSRSDEALKPLDAAGELHERRVQAARRKCEETGDEETYLKAVAAARQGFMSTFCEVWRELVAAGEASEEGLHHYIKALQDPDYLGAVRNAWKELVQMGDEGADEESHCEMLVRALTTVAERHSLFVPDVHKAWRQYGTMTEPFEKVELRWKHRVVEAVPTAGGG